MSQVDNEKAVNRFLLSTLYCFLGAVCIYYLYRCSVSTRTVLMMPTIYWTIMVISGVAAIWFAFRHWVLKKWSLYYMVMFLIIALCAAFLQYYPKIDLFFITYKRFLFVGAFVGIVYCYELIRYFIKAGKKRASEFHGKKK